MWTSVAFPSLAKRVHSLGFALAGPDAMRLAEDEPTIEYFIDLAGDVPTVRN